MGHFPYNKENGQFIDITRRNTLLTMVSVRFQKLLFKFYHNYCMREQVWWGQLPNFLYHFYPHYISFCSSLKSPRFLLTICPNSNDESAILSSVYQPNEMKRRHAPILLRNCPFLCYTTSDRNFDVFCTCITIAATIQLWYGIMAEWLHFCEQSGCFHALLYHTTLQADDVSLLLWHWMSSSKK